MSSRSGLVSISNVEFLFESLFSYRYHRIACSFPKESLHIFIILNHIVRHLIARCAMALVVQESDASMCRFHFSCKTMARTDPRDDDFWLTLRDLWPWNAISNYLVKYRVIGVFAPPLYLRDSVLFPNGVSPRPLTIHSRRSKSVIVWCLIYFSVVLAR
jgi:hypothetical protein